MQRTWHYRMWRLVATVWVLTLTAVVLVQSSSPVITDFLTKDLVNPEDVKFNTEEAFALPCKATGSNLKWSWTHNDTDIADYDGYPYTLSDDGTLIGNYLRATASGTYQCFVKDEKTGAVAFSRKLKVAVTVVGKFINPTNVVVKVNLGDPFKYDCPPRKHSYGMVFSWGNSDITGHYTFSRNSRRSISSNGSLYIMYVTQQDIDEIEAYKGIRCIISGANSFQRSGTLRLEKIDKNQTDSENFTLPTWSATPNAQEIAVQGKNKTLYCFASGRLPPTITWKKDGQTIVDNQDSYKISRSFFGRLLFIQNISKSEHEGIYTCEAANHLNIGNPISFDTTLKVEVPPKWAPSPPPKNINIVIENNGTLECRVTADPAPVITWYKDGKQLQSSEHRNVDGGKLQLINTTMEEVGVFQCVAENEHGMIVSLTSIDVLAWKPSFANVQFGPFHLLNEEEARLPCQPSTAAPRPTIQWFRKDELITYNKNSRYKLEEDGTLVIKQVDKDQDAVNYTCKALNFKGEATVSAVLNVLVLPELTTKPENQTIMEGAMVTLHCNATGNPTPKITWTKDGKTLATGDTLAFETQRNHSGKYVCTAENGLNISDNASAAIDVLYEPSLTTTPSNQTVIEGAKTTFQCIVTGNPTPKITWTKDGNTLGRGETLTLAPDRTNSGEYWCSANNGLSLTVNASAFLDVQYPPSLTSTPSDQTVIENEEVNFYCTATGNPVPEIIWIKDGNIVGQGDPLSFQANRDHSGKYWCSADNSLNVAVNASTELNVLFPPSLTSSPNNQTIIEGETATFICNATSNPTSKITWTKDGETVGEGDTLSFVTDRNQSGKYWCSAENGLNSTVNASAILDVQFPPRFVTQPSDQTVTENEQVTLRCSAIGNPVPEITWIKDGQTLESGETLSFKAHRDHSGKYWCSADNSLKGSVNTSAVLNVQFAPSLTSRPNGKIIIEGATVTFRCNATGNPTPKIIWTKDGKTVVEGEILSFVTNRNQSGEYWCSADNGLNSTVNASASLVVDYPPSITVEPSDQTVIENEEVILHCSAIGNPVPKITWIKDGKTLESGETLSFKGLRDQSGKYWCSADNGLVGAVNASADIDVQFPPSLTSSPNDQTIIEGAMATFRCTATGNPAPTITWTKDGKTVATGETLSFVTHRNHSGEYWCSADNGLNPTVNASANLDVQFASSLTSKPTDQTLTENEEVIFHCSAIGNPVPKITWIKDGKTVGSEDTLRFAANRSHSGKYWCLAKNDLNVTVNASANLDVQFAPNFISKPTDQTVTEGAMAIFICTATGNPTPKITWSKNGKTVATGETLSFEAFRNQSGKYWCIAENGINMTVNASVNLDVQFPPSLIIKPSDQTLTENKEVTLRCTAIGNPIPKITWVKDGIILAEEETVSFEVSRVQSGVYWCSADNGLSAAVNASAELNVQFVPSLLSKPKDKTIIEGASVTFHCNSTGNPPAKITWIKDGKTVAKGNLLAFETNRTQSGEYWCSADNGLNSTVNASASLDVHFPPSLVTKPSDKRLIENEEVTFHCAAIGNPVPKITWIKDGKTVGSEDTLRFTAKRSHSGKYWCLAKNYLNVTVNASANLDVQFAPELISTPTVQTVTEGAMVTFHCNATGNPTPKITWSKDGKTVATGETLSFETSRNQSGKYWCIAENGFNTTVNASVDLNVQFAPSLTTKPSDQTLTENQEAKLRCAAIGNPTPKITWTKNGAFLTEGELLSFKANRHHSGKYWCSVDNGLGVNVNASADLNVQFAPSLSSKPKDETIIERATVTFHCNATGNPTPKITWTKDRETVGEGDTLSFVTDRNQSGEYWCSADNALNATVNASAHLDVQYPPSLTTTPSDQTVIENEDVTFNCIAIGNPVPEIVWIKDGNIVGQGDTLSLQANRDHSGKYWCSADNGLSVAVNASAELNVQFAPSFTSIPSDQITHERDQISLICRATGNPVPHIKWSKDGKAVGTGETLSVEAFRNHSGVYWCSAENSLDAINTSISLDVQFSPSFYMEPNNNTVTEGQTATLFCNATGNPAPKIRWIKDGKTVGEENILTFVAKRNHSGKYWCSAENGFNATVQAIAYLDVQFSPSLTTEPKDQTIIEGATVTFYCNATANPTPKITWTKDGKTVGEGDTLSFVTDRTQSGEYWCSADNGLNSTASTSAHLNVQFPPSFITKPSDQTVIENKQLTLHCAATGNPVPNITWIKDNKTVGFGDTLSFGVQRKHSGKYWCFADNGLTEAVNASAELDVQYPPTLITSLTDESILEGRNVIFVCSATGNPTPAITWIKDGKTVANGDTLNFVANRNQSGKYWCSADNGLSATVKASADLDVKFPPSLTTEPSNQSIAENDEVTFYCTAIGNPVPQITWIKDEETVGQGNTLSIEALRDRSGKYWCSADNGLNITVNASANLDVKFRPSLTTSPADLTVLEATFATFYCDATGNPAPKITWTKDGKTVGEGDTLRFATDRNQSGEYWCSADNGLNAAVNASANLDVQYLPSFTALPIDQIVNEAAMASFYCEATGNPTPKITWSTDGKTLATGTVLSFKANRNQSGEYWCSADNGLGKVVNTSATLDVHYNPSLATRPTNQTIIEADNATFQCTATGNPAPKITWFKDGKSVGTGETLSFEAFRNNSGEYWCLADNGLNSTDNATAFLNVQYLPDLITKAVNQTVNETDQVTFRCAAIGNPVPKITWFKDGKAVGSGSQLSFTALRNHSGKYWCLANNGLNATVNAIAYLNVQFPPSFTKLPSDRIVTETDETTFHCTAIGNPVPVITWTKDGKTVGKGTILNLKAFRNKTGEYWCWADNGLGKAIKAGSHLDVQYLPSLTTTPDDQTLKEKSTVTFRCAAMGNPVPKITWIKNGEAVGTGNTLRFKAERKHSGTYWCSADNGLNKTVNASASLDVLFPPGLTTQPTDQAVVEFTKATFHCNATGNPAPKITWTKDGKTVGEGATLSFISDRNQSGDYWCSADNGLNATVHANANLDVQFAPSFTIEPNNETVMEMDITIFYCSATGNPAPKITWIKDGKTVDTGDTLSIIADRNQSGEYWCSADNGLSEAVNTSTYLDVQFLPSFTKVPINKTVVDGDETIFHCTAVGNPVPNIKWIKDGETVATGDTLSFEANRNHSGKYWCSVENGLGVAINASANLDVQFSPSFHMQPTNKTVTEGATATFYCNATGNPAPKIRWIKDGKTVAEENTLTFTAKRNHSGKYWCSAENSFNASVQAIAYLDVKFPPSFTTIPTEKTVKEDNEATFHCVASGNPSPKITWHRNGKTVATGNTLKIMAANRNESGNYWCSAGNGVGLDINASARLDVQFPPSLVKRQTKQTVTEGATATLHCNATGNPTPRITWTKDGKTVATGDKLSFATNRNQSGTYWCSADNGLNPSDNASVVLDVQFAPRFTAVPIDQTIIEGGKITLHCSASGNPTPRITWIKDGKTVATGEILEFVTDRNQSGEYWCSADNGIEANITTSVSLDVKFLPSLTKTPTDQTVIEGAMTAFRCTAIGNPTPKITWTKDGESVGEGDTLSFVTDRNQSGEYWCSADNGLNATVNASANLDVQYPPSLTTKPSDQTVIENEGGVILRCTAIGNPVPEIVWFKDGDEVAFGKELSFEALRETSGKYWCSVKNGLGIMVNASAEVDVQFPPSLTTTPTDQTVIEGVVATFRCNATGNPVPKISWTKNGKTVGEGDTLSFATDRNQSGEYWCSAENGLKSTANATAKLDVQFAPHFTTMSVDQTVNESDEASLHCTATGNPKPDIKWVKDGKAVGTGETLSFQAFKNHSGKYWCSADNGMGSPINATVYLDVHFSPSWIKKPTDQTVIEGATVTLHCNATGNPTPKVTWTRNGNTVAKGKTLSFEASRNQAGEYSCSAENGLGNSINASADIDVKYPTSLASTPTDQTVTEGDETTLRCTAIGNPTPNITWIKAGKTVASGDTLTFQASRNDSGEYWCSAENGLGLSVNVSAYLNVQFPPDVTITSTYLTVVESAIATFHCTAIGNPIPVITWTKDGKTVGIGEILSFEVSRNQSGTYWCSAENMFNKTAKASSYLDVHLKPERTRLTVNPDTTIAVQFGSFVKLNCSTYSRPDPDGYKFYRDQELLGKNSSGIYHLQLQRSGVYACVPYNSAGDGEKASLNIQVNAWKPSFDRVSFGPFYLFKGSQARLSCKPFAEPFPTFRWFKDGEAMSYGQNESYSLDADGSLIINKVKDADSGKYTCMAQNYLGKANGTADGILLERTQIVVRPQNQTVTEGASVDLRCKATADPLLELIYMWKLNGADITDDTNIQWLEEGNVLKLSDITFEETGVYTCVAYTPEPRGSEDSASAVVSITGVPLPPSHLQLTDCYNRRTNVSWSPVISNDTHITNYLIEQESNHEPNIFKPVYNVTNPNTTSVSLNIPGWSTLRFRVRAVNKAGPSRPSVTTPQGICTTPVGVPKKYPSNLKGVPSKANELFISWDPMPKTEWDAPGFYYILKYRRVNLGYLSDWKEEKIGDPSVSVFGVTNAGYYQLWEFKIRTGNHEGPGPESPIKRSFSGQDAPAAKPKNTEVDAVTASSVSITWKPVTVKKGSVDGYKIYYWGESRAVSSRRRRDIIPSDADVITVTGAKTQQATLTGLKPYTNYQVVVKAFNTGGEGPASAVMVVETLEAEPGPPSDVQMYPFGEFILVTWKPPREPNGIITNYQVGSAEYNGSSPENVPVAMKTVGPNIFKKLLGNATFERSYVVVVRARTSEGWGESAKQTVSTIKRLAPAKPDKPTVIDTGKDVITLMYNYGVGGGWTREFKVLYRKQEEGGEFQETNWVDHFSTQLIDINSLEPEVYEFKTVGKNSVGTSPESDVIEARPEPEPVVSGRRGSPPVYRKDWFITLIILSAGTLLLLIIVLVHRRWKRRRSSNFKVTEHEKEMEKQQVEQGVPVDIKPREDWRKRLEDTNEEASQDSLDEYGGDAYFAEDGSFVGDLKEGRFRDSVYDEIPLDDPAVV